MSSPRSILKRPTPRATTSPMSPQREDIDGSDLLDIDHSILQSLVRFSPPSSLVRTYETHSSDTYDRSPVRKQSRTYSGSAGRDCITSPCADFTARLAASRPSLIISRSGSLAALQISEETDEDEQSSSTEAEGRAESPKTGLDHSQPSYRRAVEAQMTKDISPDSNGQHSRLSVPSKPPLRELPVGSTIKASSHLPRASAEPERKPRASNYGLIRRGIRIP